MTPPLVDVRGLAKAYSGQPLFSGVDLRLDPGEFVAVLGESGVGKSTLLNCMAGLDTVDAGTVWIAGHEVTSLDDTQQALFRREHLGFVFQAFHVLPHLSVAHNVALPLLLLHRPDDARVADVLAAVGLGGLGDRLPQTHAPSCTAPCSSSPTNRRATSTPRLLRASWTCSRPRCENRGRHACSSPTPAMPRRGPTASTSSQGQA